MDSVLVFNSTVEKTDKIPKRKNSDVTLQNVKIVCPKSMKSDNFFNIGIYKS